MSNKVDHPSHYNTGRVEVIDAIEAWNLGFNLGNVVKYVARADYKGTPLEDLRKAAWYLNREIEHRTPRAPNEDRNQLEMLAAEANHG